MPVLENTPATALAGRDIPAPVANGDNGYNTRSAKPWRPYQRVLFRIGFIFFISLCIPNTLEWYRIVLHIDWTNLHYRDLYDIARFGSGIDLFGNKFLGDPLLGYANWITTLVIAIAGGLVWTAIVRARKTGRKEYNLLYYWLRVIVRYRAGIGIIGFGFTKLLPVQMPYPSLGLLNTHFGDLTAQKIYWLSIGIVPWYQVFAGIVEVSAGTLLLFRKTTTLGAILLFGALGDIVYVNFAYDGGVHVYSSYFVLLAGFLLIDDLPRLYNLLIREKPTVPVHFYPHFNSWQRYSRIVLKSATILVFLVLLFYLQLINFRYDPYKQPSVAGVRQLRGNYAVTEFRINHRLVPYSPLDSIRWQEVTFEKWSSLTYTVNRPTALDLSNGGGDPQRDVNRTFEVSGVGGGRRVFHYYADTVNKVLYLEDKYKPIPDRRNKAAGAGGDGGTEQNLNPDGVAAIQRTAVQSGSDDKWISRDAWAHIGNELNMIDHRAASARRNREFAEKPKNEIRKRMVLQYDTNDGAKVILSGVDDNKDSVYIVLNRVNRKYALSESNLQAGKYE